MGIFSYLFGRKNPENTPPRPETKTNNRVRRRGAAGIAGIAEEDIDIMGDAVDSIADNMDDDDTIAIHGFDTHNPPPQLWPSPPASDSSPFEAESVRHSSYTQDSG